MATSIITTDDLRDFKLELLDEIKKLLTKQSQNTLKKYLKSADVMELLNIGHSTLQSFRTNGTIPYTKMGGILFYDADEIQKVMLNNRVNTKIH